MKKQQNKIDENSPLFKKLEDKAAKLELQNPLQNPFEN